MENFILFIFFVMLAFLVGLTLGFLLKDQKNFIGRLVIDHSDIDGAHLFLEVDSGKMSQIHPGNSVSLQVIEKDYIPQK